MICYKCREDKPIEKFSLKGTKRQRECKVCHTNYLRQHYLNNKEYYVQKAAESKKRYVEWYSRLKDKPCTDCGGRFPPEAMDFDHISSDKIDNVSQLFRKQRERKALLDEISKCEIVCANCHRIRTHNRLKTASVG